MKLGEHKPTVIMFGGTTLYFRSGDVDSSLLESDTPKNGKYMEKSTGKSSDSELFVVFN